MREIKVYDDSHRPRDWNTLLSPSQCAVFFRRWGSEAPLSSEGAPFARFADSTFILFDGIEDARQFCEARVQQRPDLCCEVFDRMGKARPPLLVVVHPLNVSKDEFSLSSVRKRNVAAALLVLAGIVLVWWDWRIGWWLVAPTYIGLTMILVALRLLHWNRGRQEYTVDQKTRLEEHLALEKQHGQNSTFRC
jgi:hypothetical protein